MNSNYEETLDKNFDKALELCSNSYSNEELICFLKTGNIPEKQYAALEISELNSFDDAEIFLSNLINCDGKIREAVAQKFTELVLNETYREYFSKFPDILAKSTIDINANISRMVIDSLVLLKNFDDFGKQYAKALVVYIQESFDGLDKIVYKDKKYTINKQLFKLYWCLEGLNHYYQYVDINILEQILKRAMSLSEYTIREKAAQLLTKSDLSERLPGLTEILKNDSNYYVRIIMNNG
ncbi:MAG: hypothetical protein NC200_05675 [Candidatus Gastranaerophilales bacterium]|nr:hypothetical protein [Candidatus Gastranaerophilales bacterium]